jgi:hypothetical protein
MDEYVERTYLQAAEAMRRMFLIVPSRDENPVLKLIAFLVADEDGCADETLEVPVTHSQWIYWNQLVMERETKLVQALNAVIAREQDSFPRYLTPRRNWGASLLLETLDQFQTM